MKVGVAGMTMLGQVMAQAVEEKGFEIVRFGDPVVVDEPELKPCHTEKLEHLFYCDIVYIALDTPFDENHKIDLRPISKLVTLVESVADPNAVLVLLSQVSPGFTRSLGIPRLYYHMDMLAKGRALERIRNPERIVIGSSDHNVSPDQRLVDFVSAWNCPVYWLSYENVELAKIAINCYLATDISMSNALANVAPKVGANWDHIVPVLRSDCRIGNGYVLPGVLGDHISRDLTTLAAIICRGAH
jgi:UDPglucose 6-dehydrogenase